MFKYIYKNFDRSLYIYKLWLDSLIEPICQIIDRSANSILDMGCGEGYPMRLIRLIMKPKLTVGVDLFEKYVKDAKKDKLHDKYIIADIRKVKIAPKSYDVVIASQVIEHLPKKDGLKFISKLEIIAKKQVIIATPIGEMYHPPVDGNQLQLHLSHYYPSEFEELGYRILKYGRKSLLGENGLVHRVKSDPIKKLLFLLNLIISPIYYLFPGFADYYFVAYKNISPKQNAKKYFKN